MKRQFVLLWSMILVMVGAYAAPRSLQQARKIAARQMSQKGLKEFSPQLVGSLSLKQKAAGVSETSSYYYVFNNQKDDGFVIVSGDDRMPELIGYSRRGTMGDELPPQLEAFLAAYRATVDEVKKGTEEAVFNASLSSQLQQAEACQAIEPLLGDIAWGQDAPFNNDCPVLGGGGRAVTGCVATALSQLMYYHQWPDTLMTDIPSYTTPSGIRLDSVYAGEVYQWSSMLPCYSGANYTEEEAMAVAKLLSHVGRACEMDYGLSSGAQLPVDVLVKYFGYDPDIATYVKRSGYSLKEWKQLIINELNAKRPVYLSGQSYDSYGNASGHAFLCDGVDEEGLFHINWGWNGYLNGYFDITVLNPEGSGTGGTDSGEGYDMEVDMLIGIAKDNGLKDNPLVENLALLEADRLRGVNITTAIRNNASEKFGLTAHYEFSNSSGRQFVGKVALGIQQENGSWLPLSTAYSLKLDDAYRNPDMSIQLSYAFPVGNTVLYLLENNGYGWHPVNHAAHHAIVLKATETRLDQMENKIAATITAEGSLTAATKGKLKVEVTNSSMTTYLGRVYIFCNSQNVKPDTYSMAIPVALEVGESAELQIEVKPQAAGSYYVWACDDKGQEIGHSDAITVDKVGVPVYSLVEFGVNATSDREVCSVFGAYNTYLNKVYNDSVFFTYGIQNEGADGTLTLQFLHQAAPSGSLYGNVVYTTTVDVPSGEITYVSVPAKNATPGSMAACALYGASATVSLDPSLFTMTMEDGKQTQFVVTASGARLYCYFAYMAGPLTDTDNHVTFCMLDDNEARITRIAPETTGTLNLTELNHGMENSAVKVTTATIAKGALKDCKSVTNVNIGSLVQSVEKGAFEGLNPNAIIYSVASFANEPKTNFVVNGLCDSLVLVGSGYPYQAEAPFTARTAVFDLSTFERQGKYATLALPFVSQSSDVRYLELVKVEGEAAVFQQVDSACADVPYLLVWDEQADDRRLQAWNVGIQPAQAFSVAGNEKNMLAFVYNKQGIDLGSMELGQIKFHRESAGGKLVAMPSADQMMENFRGGLVSLTEVPDELNIIDMTDMGIDRIADEKNGLEYQLGKGFVQLSSGTEQYVKVYTLDGRLVTSLRVVPGKTALIALPAGVYVVGGRQVAIPGMSY